MHLDITGLNFNFSKKFNGFFSICCFSCIKQYYYQVGLNELTFGFPKPENKYYVGRQIFLAFEVSHSHHLSKVENHATRGSPMEEI